MMVRVTYNLCVGKICIAYSVQGLNPAVFNNTVVIQRNVSSESMNLCSRVRNETQGANSDVGTNSRQFSVFFNYHDVNTSGFYACAHLATITIG